MSPKAESSSSRSPSATAPQRPSSASAKAAAQPYPSSSSPKRSSNQPKSSRQQFSACGACRMRRVRCDLKDLQASNPNARPVCSNCQERSLRCIDEFAEMKQVKLLRRGRRLQEVEKVYGKDAGLDDFYSNHNSARSVFPKPRPEFFSSAFLRRFCIQRPVVDPIELSTRFFESMKGNEQAMGSEGRLLCYALLAWAASYGVNEAGVEELPTPESPSEVIRQRRERTNNMVRELLHLIDGHSLLRRPTWDGVRVLLLILPLTEDVQSQMDQRTMYEATICQVYTLCSLASPTSVGSGHGEYFDHLVRARIFWYAYTLEGVTSALRGGRQLLSTDDILAFEATLPHLHAHSGVTQLPAMQHYDVAHRFAQLPLKLSSICRQVHDALTGPTARQKNKVDEAALVDAWDKLQRTWDEFEAMRNQSAANIIQPEDVDRFVYGWKITVFDCYNVIREGLKQRLLNYPQQERGYPHGRSEMSSDQHLALLTRLHAHADDKCRKIARNVVSIMQQRLGSSFFQYDAALVRDGCFFAAMLLASESQGDPSVDQDIKTCVQALREMRWAFSKSDERIHGLTTIWAERRQRAALSAGDYDERPPPNGRISPYSRTASAASTSSIFRHQPPPLTISQRGSGMMNGAVPNTAATEDGAWGPLSATSTRSPVTGPSFNRFGADGFASHSHSSPGSSTGSPPAHMSNSGSDANMPVHALTTKVDGMPMGPALPVLLPTTTVGSMGFGNGDHGASSVFYHSIQQTEAYLPDMLSTTDSSGHTVGHNGLQFQTQEGAYLADHSSAFPSPPSTASSIARGSTTSLSEEPIAIHYGNNFYVSHQ